LGTVKTTWPWGTGWPCILAILDDLRGIAHALWFGRPRPEEGGAAQGPAPDLHGAPSYQTASIRETSSRLTVSR
jgi:hypothetical protein